MEDCFKFQNDVWFDRSEMKLSLVERAHNLYVYSWEREREK